MKFSIHTIREYVNIRLYDHKEAVIHGLRIMSILISLIASAALIYYHGVNVSDLERIWIARIIRFSLGFYVFKYIIRIFYDFHPKRFIRSTWIEALLILLIIMNAFFRYAFNYYIISSFGEWLGFKSLDHFLLIFIQAYLLIIVALETGKASQILPKLNISPPKLFTFSFLILIAIGTGLLMLPEMNALGQMTSFKTALFTSISACCVTGLSTVDVSQFYSSKGHLIIMLLIQLGGLNIIAFASVFALFTKNGIGIKHTSLLQQNFNMESLDQTEALFRRIFTFSLIIEGIGTLILFFSWGDMEFSHFGQRLFYSLFHSISAFNNAGFSLFSDGLAEPILQMPSLQVVIALLIVFGSFGFPALGDLLSISILKERYQKPWVHLKVQTKIAIYSTVFLILVGALLFFAIEREGVLEESNYLMQISHSFFQSITARTAGFNTVDFGLVGTSTLLLMILLMFIGANPGSTGGGIKTTTFALVLLSAYSTIRGKERLEVFKSTIPFDLLNKAVSIFLFSLSLIFLGSFLLSLTDSHIALDRLVFEQVSAFCTVGLSTGITSELSQGGQIIIMFSMFIGRIGTLTLAFALSNRKESNDYKYPKTNVMVG